MKMQTLSKLFEDQLKDLYRAESQLVKALPKMAKKASASGLRDAFTSHLEETRQHVERLDQDLGGTDFASAEKGRHHGLRAVTPASIQRRPG
jgi:ferritin-like metal-binding protein YciE